MHFIFHDIIYIKRPSHLICNFLDLGIINSGKMEILIFKSNLVILAKLS